MMESVRELLKKAAGVLKICGHSDNPILDAEVLLVYALNRSGMCFDRLKLVTQSEYLVEGSAAQLYFGLIAERSKGKPVQYIVNRQEFMGLELHVAEGVLIPRADTEIVVEKIMQLARGIREPKIIDMCTGSGAIAVSLAMNIPDARLWAADISDVALDCCSVNVNKFGLLSRISIIKSDLFENIRVEGVQRNMDIIVSNPPYIESSVINDLGINVRGYEPHLALDGGRDGLVYYRRIVQESAGFLKANGILAFEIGYDQGEKVKNIMKESGYYGGLKIQKDLAGFDRCIWGYRY